MSKLLTLLGIFSTVVLLIDNADALNKVASTTDNNWILATIRQHNKYRHHHGAPDLIYNETLCEISQYWANELLGKDKLEHNPEVKDEQIGENYYKYEVQDKAQEKDIDAERPVDAWYNEIKDYDFATGKGIDGKLVGHFTQIVWIGSLEMCSAMATKKKDDGGEKVIIVSNYWPNGNVNTRYTENVLPYTSLPNYFGHRRRYSGGGGGPPKLRHYSGGRRGGPAPEPSKKDGAGGKGKGKGGNNGPRESASASLVLFGFCSIAVYFANTFTKITY